MQQHCNASTALSLKATFQSILFESPCSRKFVWVFCYFWHDITPCCENLVLSVFYIIIPNKQLLVDFVVVFSFYRFVLEPELKFTEYGLQIKGPQAKFDQLPLKPLLTLGMDPPESWLVESVESVYDLDNICMDEVMQYY